MKTKYAGKLPKHAEPPEALKKALEKARDERSRKVARETTDALTALHKKQ